jgi:hypothetical protein
MVYVNGKTGSTFKHETMKSAENEAKRLSELLNSKAYVLRSIESVELNKFRITEMQECKPLPINH